MAVAAGDLTAARAASRAALDIAVRLAAAHPGQHRARWRFEDPRDTPP